MKSVVDATKAMRRLNLDMMPRPSGDGDSGGSATVTARSKVSDYEVEVQDDESSAASDVGETTVRRRKHSGNVSVLHATG